MSILSLVSLSQCDPAQIRNQSLTSPLTDVCTLHPTNSHSTHLDPALLPLPTQTSDGPLVDTLEIHPGDPLLRPRALHSPSASRQFKGAPASFPSPATSLAPSSHPPCPPSRAPSPDNDDDSPSSSKPSTPTGFRFGPGHLPTSNHASSEKQKKHRWILHPRRGHAALNSGLKSLSGRELVVVGRPDDLMRAGGADLGTADLGGEEKRDLERGLKGMKGAGEGGIGCVPVWLDDKVHFSTSISIIFFCRGRRA